MRPDFRSLSALLSSIALASCLADIPELSGSTSTSTGASTSGTTVGSTAATGFCASQPKNIDFCADFENAGGASFGWSDTEISPPYAHAEQDLSFGPDPPTLHAWVEENQEHCIHARLLELFEPDRDTPMRIDLRVHPASFGIISSLSWKRGDYDCNLLVRYLVDQVFVSFQGYDQVGTTDHHSGMAFPHTLQSPFGEWHRVRVTIDRESGDYTVQLDEDAVVEGTPPSDYADWAAVCTQPAPEGELTVGIGSYCIDIDNGDLPTDAYFDDVIFDFEDGQ